MSLIKKSHNKDSKKLSVDELAKEFEANMDATLRFRNYSKTKIVEKAKQWNKIAIEFLDRVDDEENKDELAYKFAIFMINKMEKLSGEQPILQSEIEERFMRKLTK